jgi:hypothetical protein
MLATTRIILNVPPETVYVVVNRPKGTHTTAKKSAHAERARDCPMQRSPTNI